MDWSGTRATLTVSDRQHMFTVFESVAQFVARLLRDGLGCLLLMFQKPCMPNSTVVTQFKPSWLAALS